MNMATFANNSNMMEPTSDPSKMELYSIVLSVTTLSLAVFFGGGASFTVLVSMCTNRILTKLRHILYLLLLIVCCGFDFIWCPLEISRLIRHQASNLDDVEWNKQQTKQDLDLKFTGYGIYILLISALAALLVLICLQNFLKFVKKYDEIPKLHFGIITIFIWLVISSGLAVAYLVITLNTEDETSKSYHIVHEKSFFFKLVLQSLWLLVLILMLCTMVAIRFIKTCKRKQTQAESVDLNQPEQLTVPTFLIKEVEEDEEKSDENEKEAMDIIEEPPALSILPVQDKSSLRDDNTSTLGDLPSPSKCKVQRTPNHLGVNMATILGRRRHTIAQISDPHFDMLQRAKQYNYVRKFSVDIQALQAQLENPKLSATFPFHSETNLKKTNTLKSSQPQAKTVSAESIPKCRGESIHSDRRDSICPTPPAISITPSDADGDGDGDDKQDDFNITSVNQNQSNIFKFTCLLVSTFTCCMLPMLVTEAISHLLTPGSFMNILTCTTALSLVQTIIYPYILFCMDSSINKVVTLSLTKCRACVLLRYLPQEAVATTDADMSDTEV